MAQLTTSEIGRRWFEEVWNQRNQAMIDRLAAPRMSGQTRHGRINSAEQFKQMHAQILHWMPDIRLTVEDVISEGNKGVVRWSASGTVQGKRLSFTGMTWFHTDGAQMVEGWDEWDPSVFNATIRAAYGSDALPKG